MTLVHLLRPSQGLAPPAVLHLTLRALRSWKQAVSNQDCFGIDLQTTFLVQSLLHCHSGRAYAMRLLSPQSRVSLKRQAAGNQQHVSLHNTLASVPSPAATHDAFGFRMHATRLNSFCNLPPVIPH